MQIGFRCRTCVCVSACVCVLLRYVTPSPLNMGEGLLVSTRGLMCMLLMISRTVFSVCATMCVCCVCVCVYVCDEGCTENVQCLIDSMCVFGMGGGSGDGRPSVTCPPFLWSGRRCVTYSPFLCSTSSSEFVFFQDFSPLLNVGLGEKY